MSHFTGYLSLDQLHPLVAGLHNGSRDIHHSLSSNLLQNIVNHNVGTSATHTSTAVDQERAFGWVVLGLHSTVEPKNRGGIVRHSVIWPGGEVVLSCLEVSSTSLQLWGIQGPQ